MRHRAVLAALLVATAASVAAAAGGDTAISPNRRWRAWIRPEAGEGGASGAGATSLWITDRRSGASRKLFSGGGSADPRRDTASLAHPVFSLDGGHVYVEADAYATSPAVHQIALAGGRERFVVDGTLLGVLRNGPWRGFLVVQQHRYRAAGGSYDPILVYRPDGRQVVRVVGSERDADRALRLWLRKRGWRLS